MRKGQIVIFGYEIKSIHNFIMLVVIMVGLVSGGMVRLFSSGRDVEAFSNRMTKVETDVAVLQSDRNDLQKSVAGMQVDIRLIKQGNDFNTGLLNDVKDSLKDLQRRGR